MSADAWDNQDDAWSKVKENRVRRVAERRGYVLQRNRRRDPKALDYGTYSLSSSSTATADSAPTRSLTLSEAEAFLEGEDQ